MSDPQPTHQQRQLPNRSSTETVIRRILFWTLVLGLVGTSIELLLLEHFEDWRQRIPLVLLGCAALVLIWHGVDRRAAPVRALRIVMLAFAAAGALGLSLHYRGNREFELEMYPTLAGLELFRRTMMGATPALAPGTMIELALVGFAYTFRHPRLTGD